MEEINKKVLPHLHLEKQTQPSTEPNQHITEEEAIAIALQSISGKVDGVKTEEVGGVTYYLIEIERENGQEGVVEIHGITGEVISITWDD
ncbi:PepSY domain-containing protein [Bacillus sp. T3]|uniref:PepSY domain-containing protein n=1 Tax=Bacillus sp. T3 TaxID=467262 RepID=UPI0029826E4A|nr:PepSY domain-containing protein [Bacillus sp. T3]